MKLLAPYREAARAFRSSDRARHIVEIGCGKAEQLVATNVDSIVGIDTQKAVDWLTVYRTERGDWFASDFGHSLSRVIDYRLNVVLLTGALASSSCPQRLARFIKPIVDASELTITIKPQHWSDDEFSSWLSAASMHAAKIHHDDGTIWSSTERTRD